MYQKTNNREHFSLTQNFSIFIEQTSFLQGNFDMFDLFLTFVDRYFFIPHGFSIEFYVILPEKRP